MSASFRTKVDQLHACLSWLTVENRLSFNILLLFKTVMCSQTPLFIQSQIVFSNTVHGHNTRASSNGQLVLPRPKSNSLKRSFIYRSLSLWNDLPRHLCSINSKLTFKKHLRFHLIQWGVVCWFFVVCFLYLELMCVIIDSNNFVFYIVCFWFCMFVFCVDPRKTSGCPWHQLIGDP